MREFQMLVRIRTDSTFNPARESLRAVIADHLPAEGLALISISPLPVDRYIKPRKAPVRRDYPLLSFMETTRE